MAFSQRALDPKTQNSLATHFALLHQPGNPILLANVYDSATANAVLSHPNAQAIATASYAVAATHGVADDDMTLAQNLASIRTVAAVVTPTGKPLSVDLQGGYDDVAATVRQVIPLGVVGCNIEDADPGVVDGGGHSEPSLRGVEDAVARIKAAKRAANELGVPSFVVNARTDVLVFGGSIDDAIARGKRYLDAGATTVFVWGGSKRGVSREEVGLLVSGLDGMVNVKMNLGDGFLGVEQLKKLGVARVSVGPELFLRAMEGYRKGVESVLGEWKGGPV